jgi:hypothetical protein
MLRAIAVFAAVSSCSIICGCDVVPDCLDVGGMFGPCDNDECSPGLLCFGAKSGHICVPPSEASEDWSVNACAARVGNLECIESEGFCAPACGPDDPCELGTTCDGWTGLCVYPW